MSHKTMARLLRVVMIILALCGIFMHLWWIPFAPKSFFPISRWWAILANIALIPCWAVLVIGWKIAASIADEKEFCYRNAKRFRVIFYLSLIDSIFFALGSIVAFIIDPWSFLCIVLVVPLMIFGICISICAAVMARLIEGAAKLQEESDLTI